MCPHVRAQVAGYKVKCMIAEPKGKRGRVDAHYADQQQAVHQASPHIKHACNGHASPLYRTPLSPPLLCMVGFWLS
jgi:hypothetical protein